MEIKITSLFGRFNKVLILIFNLPSLPSTKLPINFCGGILVLGSATEINPESLIS